MLTKEQVNFSDYRVIDLKEKHSVRTIITIKRKSSMDSFYFREKANILISTGLL